MLRAQSFQEPGVSNEEKQQILKKKSASLLKSKLDYFIFAPG